LRSRLAILTAALVACGCDKGPQYAPVKGRVTLDGRPLANVMVTFQPVGGKKNENPGPGSAGATDAQGYYTLKVSSQHAQGDGAVVGEHVVRVGVILEGEGTKPTDPEVGSPDGATPEQIKELKRRERIPAKYNQNSELRFTVPPGGTTEANFDLKSK
jgi:hypothetical protein